MRVLNLMWPKRFLPSLSMVLKLQGLFSGRPQTSGNGAMGGKFSSKTKDGVTTLFCICVYLGVYLSFLLLLIARFSPWLCCESKKEKNLFFIFKVGSLGAHRILSLLD